MIKIIVAFFYSPITILRMDSSEFGHIGMFEFIDNNIVSVYFNILHNKPSVLFCICFYNSAKIMPRICSSYYSPRNQPSIYTTKKKMGDVHAPTWKGNMSKLSAWTGAVCPPPPPLRPGPGGYRWFRSAKRQNLTIISRVYHNINRYGTACS